MTTTLFGLDSCDTCRKARRRLAGAGLETRFRDVRKDPLSEAERLRFLAAFGDDLVNRRSATWRGLDSATRDGDPSEIIAAHPAVMKRPVIDGPGGLTLGWSSDVEERHLAGAGGDA